MFISGNPKYMTLACFIFLIISLSPTYSQVSLSPNGDEHICLKPAEVAQRTITCRVSSQSLMWKVQTSREISSARIDKNTQSPYKLGHRMVARVVLSSVPELVSSLNLTVNGTDLPVTVECRTNMSSMFYTLQQKELPSAPIVNISCHHEMTYKKCNLSLSSNESSEKQVKAYVIRVKSGLTSQVQRKHGNTTSTLFNLDYGSNATIEVEAQNCAGLSMTELKVETEVSSVKSSSMENGNSSSLDAHKISEQHFRAYEETANTISQVNGVINMEIDNAPSPDTEDSIDSALNDNLENPISVPLTADIENKLMNNPAGKIISEDISEIRGIGDDMGIVENYVGSVSLENNLMVDNNESEEDSWGHISDEDSPEDFNFINVDDDSVGDLDHKFDKETDSMVQDSEKYLTNVFEESDQSDSGSIKERKRQLQEQKGGILLNDEDKNNSDRSSPFADDPSQSGDKSDMPPTDGNTLDEADNKNMSRSDSNSNSSDSDTSSSYYDTSGLDSDMSSSDSDTSSSDSDTSSSDSDTSSSDTETSSSITSTSDSSDLSDSDWEYLPGADSEGLVDLNERSVTGSDKSGLASSDKSDRLSADIKNILDSEEKSIFSLNSDGPLTSGDKNLIRSGTAGQLGSDKRSPFSSGSTKQYGSDEVSPYHSDSAGQLISDGMIPHSSDITSRLGSEKKSPFDSDIKDIQGSNERNPLETDSKNPFSLNSKSPFGSDSNPFDSDISTYLDSDEGGPSRSNTRGRLGSVGSSPFNSDKSGYLGSDEGRPFSSDRRGKLGSAKSSPFDSDRSDPFHSEDSSFSSGRKSRLGFVERNRFGSDSSGYSSPDEISRFGSDRTGRLGSMGRSRFSSHGRSQLGSVRGGPFDSDKIRPSTDRTGRSRDRSRSYNDRSDPYVDDKTSPFGDKHTSYGDSSPFVSDTSDSLSERRSHYGEERSPFSSDGSSPSDLDDFKAIDIDPNNKKAEVNIDKSGNEMDNKERELKHFSSLTEKDSEANNDLKSKDDDNVNAVYSIDSDANQEKSLDSMDMNLKTDKVEESELTKDDNSVLNVTKPHPILQEQQGGDMVSTDNITVNVTSTESEVTENATTSSPAVTVYFTWYLYMLCMSTLFLQFCSAIHNDI